MAGYTKLFGSIVRSTVWVGTSAETKVAWVTLLALADRDGVIESSVPGLMSTSGLTRAAIDEALAAFMAPDPDSRTPDHDGRRIEKCDGGWRLLNYEKYREQQSVDDLREKAAARQARFRARHTGKVTDAVTSRDVMSPQVPPNNRSRSDSGSYSEDHQMDPDPEAPPLGPATDEAWGPERWLIKFQHAWTAKGVIGATVFYGDTGDGKATDALAKELAKLPRSERLTAQALAPDMFLAFLTTKGAEIERRHYPFNFFVQAFGQLRMEAAAKKAKPAAPERPPEDLSKPMYHLRNRPRTPPPAAPPPTPPEDPHGHS